jgi:hypothetical protein
MGLPRIRRIFGFCLALAAALSLATLATAPASASTQSVVVVGNPGNQGYLDTDVVHLQMTVGGGVAPYTWSATGLTGSKLTINASSGLISGAFPNPGFYPVTVTARDSVGNIGSASFSINVGRECRHC